jgi:hypothetical protein
VVQYDRLAKVFPGEDPESLDTPGVRITIRQVTGGDLTVPVREAGYGGRDVTS